MRPEWLAIKDIAMDQNIAESHATFEPGLQGRHVGLEIHDGDPPRIQLHVVQQDWQRTPRHGAEAEKQDALFKRSHSLSPRIAAK
jgi:hypothetical protein